MTIPVFYRPEQSSSDAASYSPSADKPRQVVADWTAHEDIAPHINIESFEPASREILYAAHDKAYVDGVLDGTAENGFGNNNKGIAASLLYTTGSMLAAAKSALTARGNKVAVSPTSGFHHAHYSYGGGYCTFNGLIATAIEVHRLGLAKRILILDFDQHYGDGTQAIIDRLGLDYITHITACKSYETAEEALTITSKFRFSEERLYDLVLYQAGADIHVNDPLGGILTTEQMKQRDRTIFNGCITRRIPLVWNLAGGYQRDLNGTIAPVLSLHRNTMHQCLRAYGLDKTYKH